MVCDSSTLIEVFNLHEAIKVCNNINHAGTTAIKVFNMTYY